MKISVSQERLHKAATHVAKAASTRSLHPVTKGMKLVAADDTLVLSAYDYDTSSTMTISADVEEPGTCVIPAHVFATLIGNFPKSVTDLELVNQTLVIACGAAKATMPTIHADDYPSLPSMTEVFGEVDAADLAGALKQTAHTIADPKGMPIMQGVLLHFLPDGLTVVGTDTYRVSATRIPFDWDGEPQEIMAIVPPKMLKDFISSDARGAVQVLAAEEPVAGKLSAMIGLACDGRESTTRLIAGDYPTYQKAIPPINSPMVATVDTDELKAALARARSMDDEGMAKVTVTIGDGRIRLESGVEFRLDEEIPAKVDQGEITVPVQLKILADAVNGIDEAVLRISSRLPSKGRGVPLLLTPGIDEADVKHWHVVMSIRA